MTTSVLGYRFVQGYGFEGLPFEADYKTSQAAYGRARRAEKYLPEDYYIQATVTKNNDGTWHLVAAIKEIR